jgi:dTDP-4-amino-4,6-dideoxygalactose transaminase
MIPVTKPFLPPKEEYDQFIDQIWKRNWLTNHGPLVNELELKIKDFLRVEHFLYLNNGTIALQIAIKALSLKGEIITTPFSYVATSSAIVWENCKPVYADIDKNTFNIDPHAVERLITENTSAILATHVYGNPCDVESLEAIAQKHNLKIIYDGAHAFGTTYKGRSVFEFGDISTLSFHATKLFHTVEGGGVITPKAEYLKKLSYLRNFGHEGPEKFVEVGINGKNSEVHAAMGLCNLKYINAILEKRRFLSTYYDEKLLNLNVVRPALQSGAGYNYAYYPIVFQTEADLLNSVAELQKYQIYPRRYFYPSLDELPYVNKYEVPVSKSISSRVLCLPLYYELSVEEIDMIVRLLLRVQRYSK